MISDFGDDREAFAKVLHANISPTSPIQSQEHLYGRKKQIQQIEQALCAPGRSIFIYGDRGVGKTSLAQTVAYSQQSARHEPVMIACAPHNTFAGLMADVITGLQASKKTGATTTHRIKLGWKG